MTKKVDIWMPLYIADYLSATSRLTTEQHGAYLLLLMDYWKNGAPPDNDLVLAQITKLSPDAWSNARTMLEPFFQVSNGLWYQSRVEAEMAKAVHNKQANKERGIKGAEARWGKSNAPSIDDAYSEVCLADSTSSSSSPSSSSLSLPKPKQASKKTVSVVVDVPDWIPIDLWNEFIAMRHKVKKPPTEYAIKLIVKKLQKYQNAGQDISAILEKSITSNWIDVYEIEEKKAKVNNLAYGGFTGPNGEYETHAQKAHREKVEKVMGINTSSKPMLTLRPDMTVFALPNGKE